MNDREILDRLWEAHRETPFASLMMQRKLDLRPQEHTATLKVLSDMASSGETQNGYRIKRVASTMFKLIPQAQGGCDSLKGLPLTNENKAVLGQPESDGLSTDGENHAHGQDDPFTAVPAEQRDSTDNSHWRIHQVRTYQPLSQRDCQTWSV